MSKVVTGAVALVVIAGAGVGFASWSGGKVATDLHRHTTEALAPFSGIKVVENTVTKGLFSSTQVVSIDIGCPPAAADAEAVAAFKPSRITWRNHIKHGPIPGGRSIGVGSVDTEFVLPPEVQADVAKIFGDKAPVTIHTNLGFGGGYKSEMRSPAVKIAEANGKPAVDWQGLHASFSGDLQKGIAGGGSYAFDAPGLTVESKGAQAGLLKVGAMKFAGNVQPSPGGTLWMAPGTGKGTVESITFTGTRPSAEGPKPLVIAFDSIEATSDAKIDAGLWTGVSKFSAKGKVDDFAIDKIEAELSLKRIDAVAYEKMIVDAFKSASQCAKPEGAQTPAESADAAMKAGLAALLSKDPEYSLDRLAIVIGGKTAELSYAFGTKGVTAAEAAEPGPQLFMTKGYGKASAKVEMAWIEQVVKKLAEVNKTPEQSVESLTSTGMAMVNMFIDQGVAQGFVVRDAAAGTVKSDAAFTNGALTVNGKAVNVPMPGMAPQ